MKSARLKKIAITIVFFATTQTAIIPIWNLAWWAGALLSALSLVLSIIFYYYCSLVFKGLSTFTALETHGRDKGLTVYVKDIPKEQDDLIAAIDPETAAVVKKHLEKIHFGAPKFDREATDRILGKRKILKTVFNPNHATPVIGYVGDVGSGKTMHMRENAMLYRAMGYKIIGNDEGLKADYTFESLDELYQIVDLSVRKLYKESRPPDTYCLIMFDEIQNTFDSRSFARFPESFWARLTQRRKYGFFFHWTSPKEQYVDTRIRQMTKWVWEHSVSPYLKRYVRNAYPPMEERKIGERPQYTKKVWMREDVIDNYSTWGFVNSFSKKGPSVKDQIIGHTYTEEEKLEALLRPNQTQQQLRKTIEKLQQEQQDQ